VDYLHVQVLIKLCAASDAAGLRYSSTNLQTCVRETNAYDSLALCMQVNVPVALFLFFSAPLQCPSLFFTPPSPPWDRMV
jgi:hypothetical protein